MGHGDRRRLPIQGHLDASLAADSFLRGTASAPPTAWATIRLDAVCSAPPLRRLGQRTHGHRQFGSLRREYSIQGPRTTATPRQGSRPRTTGYATAPTSRTSWTAIHECSAREGAVAEDRPDRLEGPLASRERGSRSSTPSSCEHCRLPLERRPSSAVGPSGSRSWAPANLDRARLPFFGVLPLRRGARGARPGGL